MPCMQQPCLEKKPVSWQRRLTETLRLKKIKKKIRLKLDVDFLFFWFILIEWELLVNRRELLVNCRELPFVPKKSNISELAR